MRLHYLDYGTAGRPPMLCIHGGGANAHWFDFVAPSFSTDHHVRALDLRGHGDSEWADPPEYSYEHYASELAEVVEKLDLRDFVLMGHSMGGIVALMYITAYPGRAAKLVVVDSSPRMTAARIAEIRSVGTRQGRSYATREELVARYRLRPEGTAAPPAIVRHLAENGCTQADDGGWRHKFDRRVFTNRKFVDGFSCWSQVRIPALLVKGEISPRITPQVFAEIKACCPHVELAEVRHSDHHVTLDNPTGFTHAVRAFLA